MELLLVLVVKLLVEVLIDIWLFGVFMGEYVLFDVFVDYIKDSIDYCMYF